MGRKEREKNHRIHEIIDAAEKIMFEKGYEKTTLVEIAAESEFSKPTIYNYFQSKEEIYLAVHTKGLKIRVDALNEAIDSKETWQDKLLAYGETYFELANKYPEYIRLQVYWDALGLDTSIIRRDIYVQYTKVDTEIRLKMKKIFREAVKNSKFMQDANIDWLAAHWYYTLRTVVNQTIFRLDSRENYNDPEFYFQFLKQFIHSLE